MIYLPLEFETTRTDHNFHYSDGFLAQGDGHSRITELLTGPLGWRWITYTVSNFRLGLIYLGNFKFVLE